MRKCRPQVDMSSPSRCDAQFVSFLNGKRRVLRFMITLVTGLVASLNSVAVASAQTYPQRAVKFILPFGPAAGVDISARLLGEKLAARWGKPVVIENRPGGDGLVAINAFTSSNDEHTRSCSFRLRPSLRIHIRTKNYLTMRSATCFRSRTLRPL